MAKQLTVKQAKLVKAIAEGKTKTQAGLEAGYGTNPESARVTAHEALQNPTVQQKLQQELERQGITIEQVVAPVTRALADDNIETQLKGHDRAVKILGLKQGEGTTTIIFNQGDVVKSKYVKD